MEKKTIGAFIAVLRKANGMTQRELAERLNVSDKTISHWERDESAPDISVIPVIADIFGVSCDELLRGKRSSVFAERTERNDAGGQGAEHNADGGAEPVIGRGAERIAERGGERSGRQLKYLLDKIKTRFKTLSLISIGLAISGLCAALLFNFGFNRAYIGFIVACVFYAGAVICQSAFTTTALAAVRAEEFEGEAVNKLKSYVFGRTATIITATVVMLGFLLPLVLIPYDTFLGLTFESLFGNGLICALITLVICGIAVQIAYNSIIGRGGIILGERNTEIRRQNNSLKLKIAAVLVCVALVTLFGQGILNNTKYTLFAKGTTFDNFEDFKAHMETPKAEVYIYQNGSGEPVIREDPINDEISNEYFHKEEYIAPDGSVHTWSFRNREIGMISWGNSESLMPVTVYTAYELYQANQIMSELNVFFIIIYIIEASVAGVIYFKRRKTK